MDKKQILSLWYVLLAAPTLIFVGIWYFVMKRIGGCMHGGMLKIGKSKARVCMQTETGVTFKDVAGIDEARARVSATLTAHRATLDLLAGVLLEKEGADRRMLDELLWPPGLRSAADVVATAVAA